jgi:hypothetical protein
MKRRLSASVVLIVAQEETEVEAVDLMNPAMEYASNAWHGDSSPAA